MLSAFASAFRTPDLRNKLLFTLGIVSIFRLGSVVPTPGVDYKAIRGCIALVQDQSVYGLINLFSGGALLQLSVFALGSLCPHRLPFGGRVRGHPLRTGAVAVHHPNVGVGRRLTRGGGKH